MQRAFTPSTLGPLQLKNRFIKSATYEGFFEEGLPTQGLTDHHVAMARGGVGLTTVSYGAVSPGGRTFHNQMYIHEGTLPALVRLAEAAATGTFHCGGGERVSRYDFGLKICRAAGVDSSRIMATRIKEAQCVPPRAPDVSLDSSKLKSARGVSLLDVDGGLKLLYHSDA